MQASNNMLTLTFVQTHTHTHMQSDSPDLEWFPRLQCMSLRSEEAEPEQNEMKELQQQLQDTTALVRTLSKQLGELRDNVSLVYKRLV